VSTGEAEPPKAPGDDSDDLDVVPPLYYGLTPNQVVAYNLQQIRRWRRLTQDQAAELIEPFVGKRWSKANFSAAERSVAGERIRQFDADEIVAFAKAFDVPVAWFLLPPLPWADDGAPVHLQLDANHDPEPLATLADLVFGDDEGAALLGIRLQGFLQELGPAPISDVQARIARLVDTKKSVLVEHTVTDLGQWQIALRSLANQLEDLQVRARDAARLELRANSPEIATPAQDGGPAGTKRTRARKRTEKR
jgi:hypothetical protein